MIGKKKMPLAAQRAAVRSLMDDDGKSLKWIKKNHGDLAEGIKAIEADMAEVAKPKGSGPVTRPQLPKMRLHR